MSLFDRCFSNTLLLKNQLPGFYVSETLVENGLNMPCHLHITCKFYISTMQRCFNPRRSKIRIALLSKNFRKPFGKKTWVENHAKKRYHFSKTLHHKLFQNSMCNIWKMEAESLKAILLHGNNKFTFFNF